VRDPLPLRGLAAAFARARGTLADLVRSRVLLPYARAQASRFVSARAAREEKDAPTAFAQLPAGAGGLGLGGGALGAFPFKSSLQQRAKSVSAASSAFGLASFRGGPGSSRSLMSTSFAFPSLSLSGRSLSVGPPAAAEAGAVAAGAAATPAAAEAAGEEVAVVGAEVVAAATALEAAEGGSGSRRFQRARR
jgi:hypothetical protein